MLRILIPTDFSLLARKAAVFAHRLSQHIDAEYVLLHCDNKPRPAYAMVGKLDDIIRKEAMENLHELADSVKQETGLHATIASDFIFGDPISSLEQYCKDHHIDLVVMGTKGETVIQNRLFGSVASGVMEHVTIPVFFVPAAAEPESPRSILFATDLTDLDRELKEIIAFARMFGAKVNVVHVYPEILKADTFDEERMQMELIAKTDYPNLTFSAVMDSDIIKGINSYIADQNPDMLAMFTYKTGILEFLFNESITEELAGHTDRPLLVLRKH